MRFLRLTITYDGTDFFGWQWQPDRRTVQGVLEAALAKVTGEIVRVTASGRTDAGVHALGQAVSFSSSSPLPPDVLVRALNANLPADVSVREAVDVAAGFNAIDAAVSKRYRYLIQDGPLPDIFARRHVWYLRFPLDAEAMHEAAQPLRGKHDFKSFEAAGSRRVSTVRTILDFSVRRCAHPRGSRIAVEVEADGFLYNMVRNLVGTLVEVGRGKRRPGWPEQVLAARDRRLAGMTAPPQGLYLTRVRFD